MEEKGKGKEEKSQLFNVKSALKESFSKNNKDQVKFNKSMQGLFHSNIDYLSKMSTSLSNIDKILNYQSKLLINLKPTDQKSFIKKTDPNKKVVQELIDLENLMKENNKLQKEKDKKKGMGLAGLLGLAGVLLGIGGLAGFLLTGKQEFLYSTVKGFVKGFQGLFAPAGGIFKGLKKVLGIDVAVDILKEKFGKIGNLFKGFGKMMGIKELEKGAEKGGLKTLGKLGKLGKSALKKIPGIGLLMGIAFGIGRFKKGDIVGGIGEIASGLVSMVPGIGTWASIAIDALLLFRDFKGGTKVDSVVGGASKAVVKGLGKMAMKKIPGVGLLMGIGLGISRFKKGDIVGGIGEIASGLVSIIPGFGTLASIAIDALLMWKDFGGVEKTAKAAGSLAKMGVEGLKKIAGFGPIVWITEGIKKFATDPLGALQDIGTGIMSFSSKAGGVIGNIISLIKAFDVSAAVEKTVEVLKEAPANTIKFVGNIGKSLLSGGKKAAGQLKSQVAGGVATASKGFAEGFSGGASDKNSNEMPKTISTIKTGSIGRVIEPPKVNTKFQDMIQGPVDFINRGIGWFLNPADKPNIKGINPTFWNSFEAMSQEYDEKTGGKKSIRINSGYRNQADSLHGAGQAIDIHAVDANNLEKMGLLKKYGFHRPLLHWSKKLEPWHIEQYPGESYGPRDTNNYAYRVALKQGKSSEIGDGGLNLSQEKLQNKLNRERMVIDLSEETITTLAQKMTDGYKNSIPNVNTPALSIRPVGRG